MTICSQKGISRFILYVTLPALIIDSMNFNFSYEMFSNSVILLIAGDYFYTRFYGFLGVVSAKALKITGDSRSVFLYAVLFGNVAYMGYPVVELIIGEGRSVL